MLVLRSKLTVQAPETILQWIENNEISEVSFLTNPFGKDTFSLIDIYEQLNIFLTTIPVVEQKTIYDCFIKIRYNLDNSMSTSKELVADIRSQVKIISEILNVDRIYNWVKNYSNILIPTGPNGFKDEYVHDINNNKSPEKTYLRDDYIYLVAYCISLKIYVPLWGEYISLIKKEIGTDFKEYNSFQLLNQTNYINTRPYQKLITYIEHIITEDMFNSYNIINNISSEDYVYHIFCLTNVRRLPFIDIKTIGQEEDSKLNIITFIYKFIKQKVKGNNTAKTMVKDKDTISANVDENSKISVLEKYKIKTNISLEDIVELEYSVRDPYLIAQRLSVNSDLSMLEEALQTSNVLRQLQIPDCSIRLLQWVFKPVISPRGILYLSKPTLVNLLAVLQVVLWARGYKDLALLATTHKVSTEKYINVFSMDNKCKISKETLEQLDKLYPFTRPVKPGRIAKIETRYILNTIDEFTNILTDSMLRITASDKYIEEVYGNNIRKYTIHPDIKVTLAKLFVELGSKSWI